MEPETPTPTDEQPTPDPAPDPTPDPTPTPPDPAAQLREEIAELRGELRGRTATAPAPPPAPRVATAEDYEAAYASGRITLEQRDAAIDDLKFHSRYEQVRARERQQEADQQADLRLRELVRQHPELGQAGSPMLRDVEERIRVLAGRGFDARALGTQLTAAEYVVEQRAARTARPTPPPVPVTSGAGSFVGGPPSGAAPRDEFADIPQSTRDYWTRTGVPVAKWKDHAEAWRANQQRRAAKYQAFTGRQAG